MKPLIKKPCEKCGKDVRITKNKGLKNFEGQELCAVCFRRAKNKVLRSILPSNNKGGRPKKKRSTTFKSPEDYIKESRTEKEKTLARMGKPLKKLEKQFLYKELRQLGLSEKQIQERIAKLEEEVKKSHEIALSRRTS